MGLLSSPCAWSDDAVPDPDLATEGMRRLGPFHVRPVALLKDAGYDDNLRYQSEDRLGDYTATAGAGVEALLLTGDRGGVRLSEEVDYVGFRRTTELNHWNTVARARGILLLNRWLLSLEDRFTSQRERPNSEIDQRLRRATNAVTAALSTIGKDRLGMRAYVRSDAIDYSSDDPALPEVGRLLNRRETTLSVVGEARLLRKTTFTLEGAVARIGFDDPGVGRDARKRAILPGIRFDPSAAIQGDLQAGPLVLTAPDRPGDEYKGIVADGRLSARLGRAARIKTELVRNVDFSITDSNLFYLDTHWSAAYEHFFSRRLSGELSYGRGLTHFPNAVVRPGPPAFTGIRNDRLTTTQVSVRYRPNPQLTFAASAYRTRRDSTDDFFDIDRTLYTIGSTYNF